MINLQVRPTTRFQDSDPQTVVLTILAGDPIDVTVSTTISFDDASELVDALAEALVGIRES